MALFFVEIFQSVYGDRQRGVVAYVFAEFGGDNPAALTRERLAFAGEGLFEKGSHQLFRTLENAADNHKLGIENVANYGYSASEEIARNREYFGGGFRPRLRRPRRVSSPLRFRVSTYPNRTCIRRPTAIFRQPLFSPAGRCRIRWQRIPKSPIFRRLPAPNFQGVYVRLPPRFRLRPPKARR